LSWDVFVTTCPGSHPDRRLGNLADRSHWHHPLPINKLTRAKGNQHRINQVNNYNHYTWLILFIFIQWLCQKNRLLLSGHYEFSNGDLKIASSN
jgi:hypothetical protein